jgi:hypothetical protein
MITVANGFRSVSSIYLLALSVLKTGTGSTQIFPGNINIKINLLWLEGIFG